MSKKLQKCKLQLAATKESYKDQYCHIYLENNNYLTFAYSEPPSREKFDERYDNPSTDPCFVLVNESDKVIGFCGIDIASFDGWGEINFMIRHEYQNQGYGKLMLELVIEQMKNIGNIEYLEAETFSNVNSEKLLMSVGFVKAGFLPNYRKVIIDGIYTRLNSTNYYYKLR